MIASTLSRASLRLTLGCARSINLSFILFLGKMTKGGMKDPAALMQISTITSWPFSLSAGDSDPHLFLAPICDYFVVDAIWFAYWTCSINSKKALTVPWLNPPARAADVGSGILKEIASLWRAMNSRHQSFPASRFLWLNL